MGEKLRMARLQKRRTQWDLQLETGLPQCRISLIERGYLKPKKEEKVRLAKALGVTQEELFSE